ncbi:MAG: ATP-binding protein [Candidatus Vecturithrix sp.]|jgi:PAS domain S-box-containing protein|nr:ATP-binding protein [Candidatus Vecturithrix sp.]
MTALTDITHKIQAFQVGAVDYITKPLEQEEVLARIVTHIRLRHLNEQLEQKVWERTNELVQMNQRLQQEINERQQAEEALQESEARFRRLAENAKDMIYRISLPDGQYEYISPAVETITGYTPQEIYQSSQFIAQVIHPDWKSYFAEAWQNLIHGEVPPYYEYQILHKSGEMRWLNERNVLIRDGNGNPVAMEGIVTDITDRKQAEEQVHRLNAELEQRVHQRTTELEAANNELQSFAYIVSHDLKAPLRAIAKLSQWLLEDYGSAFDDQGQEMVTLLINRVKRMDNLIDSILEYSRIGRVASYIEPIDLNRLVPEICDLLMPPSNIQITFTQKLPVILGDIARIQQIFANLIGNAIKFMDKPWGIIAISCEEAGSDWRFSVSDNGPGICAQYHEKIFQIFQTLHSRDEFESTGIGLTIVKKIVESYGGTIWIESIMGQGSTFYFTLPRKPGATVGRADKTMFSSLDE